MFRRVTGFVTMLCAFLLISAGLLPWAPAVYASEFKVLADSSGVRIVTGEPLFGMNNMAPGDTFGFDLEVVNDSEDAFSLAISSNIDGDSNSLFESLEVSLTRVDTVLYQGPLSGLQDLGLGIFSAGSEADIQIEIQLPTSAGNECQGMSIDVRFQMTKSPVGPGPVVPGEPPGIGDVAPDEPDPVDPPDDGGGDPGDGIGDVAPDEPDPVLPVTGTSLNFLVPSGTVMFLLGILILRSAEKRVN